MQTKGGGAGGLGGQVSGGGRSDSTGPDGDGGQRSTRGKGELRPGGGETGAGRVLAEI